MRIYFDVCCLNRPFDDQDNDRINLESQAVILILSHIQLEEWRWITSEVVDHEIGKTPDKIRIKQIRQLTGTADEHIKIDDEIIRRAENLKEMGFRSLDALHIACAEQSKVDVFLTTDDQLIRIWKREKNKLDVQVANPLNWLKKGWLR